MNEWENALVDALKQYTDSVTQGVLKAVEEVSNEAVPLLKAASPIKRYGKNAGRYAKGWKAEKRTGSTSTRLLYSVHNKTDYQITHLLEHGHKIVGRNGSVIGSVAPRVHIAPINEETQKNLEKKIEEIIAKG